MNERIKELVDKTNDLMDKEYSTDWWNAQSFYQSIWQEKFAELIVRECTQYVEEHQPRYLTKAQAKAVADSIKKQFGVE